MRLAEPRLSIGVIEVGGPSFVRRCLKSLAPQIGDGIEVLVPHDATMTGMEALQREFPWVRLVPMGEVKTGDRPGTMAAIHELFDRRCSTAMAEARGAIIALLQDYCMPDPDWCQEILRAHELPHAAFGGAVEHAGTSPLNWAVYFLDFGRFQLPLDQGPAKYLSDVNIAYKRSALESVRHLWRTRYNEATINWHLLRRGEVLYRWPRMVVRQDRGELSLGRLLVERLSWGRLFGAARVHAVSPPLRVLYVLGAPLIPFVLLGRSARKVIAGGRNVGWYMVSLPVLCVLVAAWCAGEWAGYVTGKPSPVGES